MWSARSEIRNNANRFRRESFCLKVGLPFGPSELFFDGADRTPQTATSRRRFCPISSLLAIRPELATRHYQGLGGIRQRKFRALTRRDTLYQ